MAPFLWKVPAFSRRLIHLIRLSLNIDKNLGCKNKPLPSLGSWKIFVMGGFICTFSPLISLSITLRTINFRNQFRIRAKYFDMACYLKQETYISFEVQRNVNWSSELIIFNYLRCRSNSTALGTRTGYWKPTRRGTDETPHGKVA